MEMKANELIAILTEMVNRHGDLEIGVEDFELEYFGAIKEVCVRQWRKIGNSMPGDDQFLDRKTIHIIGHINEARASMILSESQEGLHRFCNPPSSKKF